MKKPQWLKVKFPGGIVFENVKKIVKEYKINTVCESAACPNKGECWGKTGTVTFMIMGNRCTRNCRFCKVNNGEPSSLDASEPNRIAKAIMELCLKYVVITSVTRDDLEDGGAEHFTITSKLIRNRIPNIIIEILVPDFRGKNECIERLASSSANIFSHNVETVERLTPFLRSGADYKRSLKVLELAKQSNAFCYIKSSLILGLGENKKEIYMTIKDLHNAGVDIIHIGQYLQPSNKNIPVTKYYTPEEFNEIEKFAKGENFKSVLCGPLVRSSYHASFTGATM